MYDNQYVQDGYLPAISVIRRTADADALATRCPFRCTARGTTSTVNFEITDILKM